jgi:hypothetical protein
MKPYRIVISYGDGCPKKSFVFANNGIEASDIAYKEFPAARYISVIGSVTMTAQPKKELEKPKLMYGCELLPSALTSNLIEAERKDLNGPVKNKTAVLQEALKLVEQGVSLACISKSSGVSRTTLRKWISANT